MLYSKFKGITSTRSESAISWRKRERERERILISPLHKLYPNLTINSCINTEQACISLLDLSLFQKLSICNNHFYTVWIDIYHLQSNKSHSVIHSFNSALSWWSSIHLLPIVFCYSICTQNNIMIYYWKNDLVIFLL